MHFAYKDAANNKMWKIIGLCWRWDLNGSMKRKFFAAEHKDIMDTINEKKVLVRYSYADFDKAQSDSGTKIPSRSVTFLATSLKDANKKWKQYKSQQLNFGHLKVVLFANGKKDEKIIKELVNEPQIAKSVYVLKTDRNLSDIFKKEDKLSISFGEYLSKKLEIKDSKNLTLGRIYR